MNSTVTGILQNIFVGGFFPLMYNAGLTALAALLPPFGAILAAILRIPPVNFLIQKVVSWGLNWCIARGVIAVKEEIIDQLDDQAKANYAPQIALLREMQSQPSMTPEQQAEYAKRLQDIVKNHPGVVNA